MDTLFEQEGEAQRIDHFVLVGRIVKGEKHNFCACVFLCFGVKQSVVSRMAEKGVKGWSFLAPPFILCK